MMMLEALAYGLGLATLPVLRWVFEKKPAIPGVDEDGLYRCPVDTISQMLAIPAERRERFLTELPQSLRRIWALSDRFPVATLPGAVWVDDGLGEFRPNVINAPEALRDEFATTPLA
jgi:hypothetical protein